MDNPFQAEDLHNIAIPNTAHYVWCKNSTIKFENYLSILSVWKLFGPDSIEFHTKYDISKFDDKYNLWMEELQQNIPGFLFRLLPAHWDGEEHGCGIWFAIAVLDDRGGIYFSEDLLVTEQLKRLNKKNFWLAFDNANRVSILMSNSQNKNLQNLKINLKMGQATYLSDKFPSHLKCQSVNSDLNVKNSTFYCAHMPGFYPRNIMRLNNTFGEYSRRVLYDSQEIVSPRKLMSGTIPKIIHLVWFRRKEMSFMMYLSLKSTLTIIQPEKIYIHGDNQLYGKYLDEFSNNSRIVWVIREEPTHIFGHRIMFTQHKSDIVRADVLLKYGGIYMDWDVLWLKPIDDILQVGYDAIVNFDHVSPKEYPNTINLGVFMSKPDSDFVRLWQQALKNYRSLDFYFNALQLPYKIYEKYPKTVHIEKRLQVMCFHLKCHPIFDNGFKNLAVAQPFDWKRDAYAIHFTFPDPPEYSNKSTLLNSNGMFAEIGKYILKQSFV